MRIISCASYYGTGSSAIMDYISEFSNCYSLTNYEFRFIQDPEGVSDLEYNLVENHNRHNSGHALKRFKKLVDFYSGNKLIKRYEPFFNYKWKKTSYNYINEITDFNFIGWWQYDLLDKGKWFYFRKRVFNKLLHMTIWHDQDRQLNTMPHEMTYCSRPSEQKFINCTRRYIETLFSIANKGNKPNVVVDQLVPPSNLKRYLRYFNNIKVFVVDRDPRDIYLLEKYVWKSGIIPTCDVDLFCKWYIYTRAHRDVEEFNSEEVMFIQFEDLIYRYYETTKRIKKWLSLSDDEHSNPKKHFDPNISINNTKLWQKYPNATKDIEYIEKRLSKYLYVIQ